MERKSQLLDDGERLREHLVRVLDERDFWAARARALEAGRSHFGSWLEGVLAVIGALTVLVAIAVVAIELL